MAQRTDNKDSSILSQLPADIRSQVESAPIPEVFVRNEPSGDGPELSNLSVEGEEDVDAPQRTVLDSVGHLPEEGGLDPEDFKAEVQVLQNDPNTPYYSAKTFDELGLASDLLQGIYSMGFNKPSKIQESSLPLLLQNPPRNLIAQAQNGSGKTACFSLTMISRVDASIDAPQALCLCPARELARQIVDVLQVMGKFTKVRTFCAVPGGDRLNEKITEHIVVGTPGRVLDLISKRLLPTDNMRIFVLDEADYMLESQGLCDQSKRIRSKLPKNCQFVLFSATWKDRVRSFAMKIVPNANMITVKKEQLTLEGIKQFFLLVQSVQEKFDVLMELYGYISVGQSIIFVQKRSTADRLARIMKEKHSVALLHGQMEPDQRDAVIDEFRKGVTRVLITTNLLSRGIDILQVSLVVNFDIPTDSGRPDPETYLHRIGRSGRFGRKGVAINIVHDAESTRNLVSIEKCYGKSITKLDRNDLEGIEKYLK